MTSQTEISTHVQHDMIKNMLESFQLQIYTYSFKRLEQNEWQIAFSKPTKQNPIPSTVVYMKANILSIHNNVITIQLQLSHERTKRLFEIHWNSNTAACDNSKELKDKFSEKWITSQMSLVDEYFVQKQ
jgi:hypothetical protein